MYGFSLVRFIPKRVVTFLIVLLPHFLICHLIVGVWPTFFTSTCWTNMSLFTTWKTRSILEFTNKIIDYYDHSGCIWTEISCWRSSCLYLNSPYLPFCSPSRMQFPNKLLLSTILMMKLTWNQRLQLIKSWNILHYLYPQVIVPLSNDQTLFRIHTAELTF